MLLRFKLRGFFSLSVIEFNWNTTLYHRLIVLARGCFIKGFSTHSKCHFAAPEIAFAIHDPILRNLINLKAELDLCSGSRWNIDGLDLIKCWTLILSQLWLCFVWAGFGIDSLMIVWIIDLKCLHNLNLSCQFRSLPIPKKKISQRFAKQKEESCNGSGISISRSLNLTYFRMKARALWELS